MLSRAQKKQNTIVILKKRSDFVAIQTDGRKWISPSVIVQVKDNNGLETRLGFTVTKRTSKSAVKRNRIKRRLRAAASKMVPGQAKAGCDYVLIGRPASLEKPFADMCRDLAWCIKRLECHAPASD
jgi:ribonuclease P protein component